MSDFDIRRLGRLSRSYGSDVESKAKKLREELRSGLIAYERLIMAARLGDEACRMIVPEWIEEGEVDWKRNVDQIRDSLESLRKGTEFWNSELKLVSYALKCSERIVPIYSSLIQDYYTKEMFNDSIRAVRNWLVHPYSEEAMITTRELRTRLETYADNAEYMINGMMAEVFYILASVTCNIGSRSCYLVAQICRLICDIVSDRTDSGHEVDKVVDEQKKLLISYLLNENEKIGDTRRNHSIVPHASGDNLPSISTFSSLPALTSIPPRVSFDLLASGNTPLVMVPEGVDKSASWPEKAARVQTALLAVMSRKGFADINKWYDLLSAAKRSGAEIYLVDRRADRWLLIDVTTDFGGETGELTVRHVGPESRKPDLLVDLHKAFGYMIPTVMFKPVSRRNGSRRNKSVEFDPQAVIPVRVCKALDNDHKKSIRAYGHTYCKDSPTICVASAFFGLPDEIRDGILAHEIGHLIAGPDSGEAEADEAFERTFGAKIDYTDSEHGRCLQTLVGTCQPLNFSFTGQMAEPSASEPDTVIYKVKTEDGILEFDSQQDALEFMESSNVIDAWADEDGRRLGWRPIES